MPSGGTSWHSAGRRFCLRSAALIGPAGVIGTLNGTPQGYALLIVAIVLAVLASE